MADSKPRETFSALNITRGMFVFACALMGLIWAEYLIDLQLENGQVSAGEEWIWRIVCVGSGIGAACTVLLGLRFITQAVFERIFPAIIAIVQIGRAHV